MNGLRPEEVESVLRDLPERRRVAAALIALVEGPGNGN